MDLGQGVDLEDVEGTVKGTQDGETSGPRGNITLRISKQKVISSDGEGDLDKPTS